MKNVSRLLLLVTVIAVAGSMFWGCKKGPDDPFFSFRSRKARVVGEYNILSRTEKYVEVTQSGQQKKININISGASLSTDTTYVNIPSRLTAGKDSVYKMPWTYPRNKVGGSVVQFTMSFDENGPFSGIYEYQIKHELYSPEEETDSAWTQTTIYNVKNEYRGSWDFLEGIDNYNTNERLAIIYENMLTTITTTISRKYNDPALPSLDNEYSKTKTVYEHKYANGEFSEVYRIRELRSTKMVLEQEIYNYFIQNETNTASRTGSLIQTLEEKTN